MTETTWTPEQRKLIFATVAKGLSNADCALFEAVCISSGLDPLRREIYAVTRNGRNGVQMSIQTGIDGYLKLANQTKELNGMEVLFYDENGQESEVWLSPKPPTACLVRVYRKGAEYPFTASCRYDAYRQNGQMWQKFGETMLAKCATTLALRRGFSDVISGIASADEMDQAGLAAPEALTQGTPAAVEAQPAATPRKTITKKAAPKKEKDLDAVAEGLAAATGGTVVEAAVNVGPPVTSQADMEAVCRERGVTKAATAALIELIRGDFKGGITTLQAKSESEIAAINEKFAPKQDELVEW